MNTTVFLLILYMLFQLAISLWAWRMIRTEDDYLLGGRKIGLIFASLSLFATWFGAETVMGSSGAVAEEGLSGARADPFGYTICLVLMAVFVAAQLRKHNYVTIGDFFRDRFSRSTELLAVFIMLPTSLTWAAAQLQAFAQVLSVVTGAEFSTMLMISTLLVILYTALGGLLADVMTDFVQGIFLILGLSVLLIYVFLHAGGVGAGLATIQPQQLSFVAESESLLSRLDTWAVPILGSLVAQEAISRLLATKDVKTARNACFAASGIYLLVGMIPVLIALVGSHFDLALGHQDEFLPAIAQQLLPHGLFILLAGALISAILSTIDSTLLTFAALTSHNIIMPISGRLTEKGKVVLNRSFVVIAGLLTYFIATAGDTIYELVEMSSSFGTAGLVVTLLLGLWVKKRGNSLAAIAAIFAGLVVTIIGEYRLELEAPFLTAIAASAVVYGAGIAMQKSKTA